MMSAGVAPQVADAVPTREAYRFFRSLSIDLQGRMPTPEEVAAFERPDFNLDAWIDQRLTGPRYAERLRRIYMDRMRLEVGSNFGFVSNPIVLRRVRVRDPNNNLVDVYYRRSQRRNRAETDADFCLTQAESGIRVANNGTIDGTATPVAADVWGARTVALRPWWLYRDYRNTNPSQRVAPNANSDAVEFEPVAALMNEPDGRTPTVSVRVCREEAQTAPTGRVYLSGRTTNPPRGTPLPGNRFNNPPLDSAYARAHPADMVSCTAGTGVSMSDQCGCGPGLERCMPGASLGNDPPAFVLPNNMPLGPDVPLDNVAQAQSEWARFWWSQEAVRFLDDLFGNDRDVREVLTGRQTMVNGPLSQFYRTMAGSTCCGNGTNFDYVEPVSLFEPAQVPADLVPQDTNTWRRVADRGPNAAGVLTMPIFLAKYGTRRARAHIVYQAFLCREFVAENVELTPSEEPNLMVRSGCATCHTTLEPLSSYFTRVTESGWTFLPAQRFPAENTACARRGTSISGICGSFYDPQFANSTRGLLRGAYGSVANADAGPAGLARAVTAMPEFSQCVASNFAESFLGRALGPEDSALVTDLTTALRNGNYRSRAMVRALLRADAYRNANNLGSDTWRQGAMP